jgi:hypothetical protein
MLLQQIVNAVYGATALSNTSHNFATAGGSRTWGISQIALAFVTGAVARVGNPGTCKLVVQVSN